MPVLTFKQIVHPTNLSLDIFDILCLIHGYKFKVKNQLIYFRHNLEKRVICLSLFRRILIAFYTTRH